MQLAAMFYLILFMISDGKHLIAFNATKPNYKTIAFDLSHILIKITD